MVGGRQLGVCAHGMHTHRRACATAGQSVIVVRPAYGSAHPATIPPLIIPLVIYHARSRPLLARTTSSCAFHVSLACLERNFR